MSLMGGDLSTSRLEHQGTVRSGVFCVVAELVGRGFNAKPLVAGWVGVNWGERWACIQFATVRCEYWSYKNNDNVNT